MYVLHDNHAWNSVSALYRDAFCADTFAIVLGSELFPASPVLRTHAIPMFFALSALRANPSDVTVLRAHTSIVPVLCAYSYQVPVDRTHTGMLCSERTLPCIDLPLLILRGPYRYFVLPFMFTVLFYT